MSLYNTVIPNRKSEQMEGHLASLTQADQKWLKGHISEGSRASTGNSINNIWDKSAPATVQGGSLRTWSTKKWRCTSRMELIMHSVPLLTHWEVAIRFVYVHPYIRNLGRQIEIDSHLSEIYLLVWKSTKLYNGSNNLSVINALKHLCFSAIVTSNLQAYWS